MDLSYKIGWFLKMGRLPSIKMGRLPAETPLDTQPGLGTQPRYEALGDLRVEIVKSVVINVGLVRLST